MLIENGHHYPSCTSCSADCLAWHLETAVESWETPLYALGHAAPHTVFHIPRTILHRKHHSLRAAHILKIEVATGTQLTLLHHTSNPCSLSQLPLLMTRDSFQRNYIPKETHQSFLSPPRKHYPTVTWSTVMRWNKLASHTADAPRCHECSVA
jgi:hypothetical protein